ncbi:MAG: alpha-galactosidase [Rikenellaceae bacterium]|nr:alpha-galactosidase [Rikenellaceae bacterium]
MKRFLISLSAFALVFSANAKDYAISTPNSTLIISADEGKAPMFRYYGSRAEVSDVRGAGRMINGQEAYPAFGTRCDKPFASLVKQHDGDNAVKLVVEKVIESKEGNISTLSFLLRDVAHPTLAVKLNYSAYSDCDIVKMNTEYINEGKKPVVLQKYMSAFLPIQSENCVLLHLDGSTKNECNEYIEPLTSGVRIITSQLGSRVAMHNNASFMLGLDGRLDETNCPVVAGTLVWMGNFHFEFHNTLLDSAKTLFMGGINPAASDYTLAGKKSLATPEMVFTYTTNGKGEATRNLHRWARRYQLLDGTKEREILLNSWEGVHFDTTEANLEPMVKDFAALGGEMFVVDDGWFGPKYPRNDAKSSLGDWGIATSKLPNGIRPLIELTHKHGMKFGIWIEPEMVNVKSELYEKHPDWVLRHPDFEPTYGRGGGQLLLDLTNPQVQDFVFGVVDDLLTQNPDIYYIKWDNNMNMTNTQSLYLPKALQSNLQVDFTLALEKILKRIRSKYPQVVIQLCASGGARLNYGFMPYFQEMWTSDQTDAYHRILIQWGSMNFYPSNMLAAHVGSAYSKYTQRLVPIKFRFDVASMCRLGMEMVPSKLSETERAYAKRAIAEYKTIRPVVQQGDLYRLISPYEGDKNFTSLMYVNEAKEKAVIFTYRHLIWRETQMPIIRLQGLKADAKYRIREVAPEFENQPVALNGKVVSGKILMQEGIVIPELSKWYKSNAELNEMRATNDWRSVVLELTEVK